MKKVAALLALALGLANGQANAGGAAFCAKTFADNFEMLQWVCPNPDPGMTFALTYSEMVAFKDSMLAAGLNTPGYLTARCATWGGQLNIGNPGTYLGTWTGCADPTPNDARYVMVVSEMWPTYDLLINQRDVEQMSVDNDTVIVTMYAGVLAIMFGLGVSAGLKT